MQWKISTCAWIRTIKTIKTRRETLKHRIHQQCPRLGKWRGVKVTKRLIGFQLVVVRRAGPSAGPSGLYSWSSLRACRPLHRGRCRLTRARPFQWRDGVQTTFNHAPHWVWCGVLLGMHLAHPSQQASYSSSLDWSRNQKRAGFVLTCSFTQDVLIWAVLTSRLCSYNFTAMQCYIRECCFFFKFHVRPMSPLNGSPKIDRPIACSVPANFHYVTAVFNREMRLGTFVWPWL